jgi:small subunit ribosomal protein S9
MSEIKKKKTAVKKGEPAKKSVRKKTVKKENEDIIIESQSPSEEIRAEEPAEKTLPVAEIKEEKQKKAERKKGGVVNYYGLGRRKTAIAKVWLVPGSGKIVVNKKPVEEYMCQRAALLLAIKSPLIATSNQEKFDVEAKVLGGGISSQAGAIKMGISRALLEVNPDLRKQLRPDGYLTRDPRVKERKKYGHKRARKSFQYSKR